MQCLHLLLTVTMVHAVQATLALQADAALSTTTVARESSTVVLAASQLTATAVRHTLCIAVCRYKLALSEPLRAKLARVAAVSHYCYCDSTCSALRVCTALAAVRLLMLLLL
jgi:hypothetical protein